MRPTVLPTKRVAVTIALATLLLAGCATRPLPPATPQACTPPTRAAVMAELLFGLSIPSGGTVSPAQFDAFAATEIAPRFAGFTMLPGTGQWQGGREGARLVEIVAADDADTAGRLHAIRAAYRARFAQKSVGLITVQSCASF